MRIVSGTVQRVTVRKAGGWGIATIKLATNDKARLTIVGRGVADLTQGELVEVEGEDVEHRTYGNQLAVSEIRMLDQPAHIGLEPALMMFKGIGSTYAGRLSAVYVEDQKRFYLEVSERIRVDDVLANWIMPVMPPLVTFTKNLGPKGLRSFVTRLRDLFAVFEERVDGDGRSSRTQRVRSFRKPSPEALAYVFDIFEKDPYKILTAGYFFREADAILIKQGIIGIHDEVRLKYAMDDMLTEKQDVLFPWHSIVSAAYSEFGIELEPQSFTEDVEPAVLPNNVVRLEIENTDYVAHRKLIVCEDTIQAGLVKLMQSPQLAMPQISDKDLCDGLPYKLIPEQLETVKRSVCSPISIITGGPGVGKTSSVLGLINALRVAARGMQILMAAPTNKAARRLSQQTNLPATSIHKLLESFPDNSYEGDKFGCGFMFFKNSKNPFRNTIIVLDECSMIDTRLFAAIFDAIGSNCRLILIGDHKQLPPIREGYPFFDLLDRVPTSHLIKIMRSNPGQMQLNHARIRAGDLQKIDHNSAVDWEFVECDTDEEIMVNAVQIGAKLYKEHGTYGFQIITPRRSNHKLSTYEINRKFREVALHTTSNSFVPKDKGICNTNMPSVNMINGDMFMVDEVLEHANAMKITKEIPLPTDPEELQIKMREDGLDFGWAITVHKYQGCETDVVVFVISSSFGNFVNRNMVYTAITRAKKKVILIGDKQAFHEALLQEERERLTVLNILTRPGLENALEHGCLLGPDEDSGEGAVDNGAEEDEEEL